MPPTRSSRSTTMTRDPDSTAAHAAARPAAIGYVSCDPVSLARDAGFLVKAGYAVEGAALYDFYPQTSHVESYARFTLD